MCYVADLRRASLATADAALKVPADMFGNVVGIQTAMPPAVPLAGTSPQAEHVRSILSAAACTVHAATQSLQADPNFVRASLGLVVAIEDSNFWKGLLAAPGLVPFRDCAVMISSWKGGSIEKADFGKGKPWVVAGMEPGPSHLQILHGFVVHSDTEDLCCNLIVTHGPVTLLKAAIKTEGNCAECDDM